MATGNRNEKGKATDIVRHYSRIDGGVPVCETKGYGYSTTNTDEVSCKKCKKKMVYGNVWYPGK